MKKETKHLLYGLHPVAEAINSGREINKILIKKGLRGEPFQALFTKIRELNIPFQYVPVEKLNRVTGGNHQGIIAFLSLIEYKSPEEIIQSTYEAGKDPFVLVLDRVTDVRNFGAIARTAECAGVDIIIIPERESASITPDAIKSSAGALNRIAVSRTKDIEASIKYIKAAGIKVVAASEKADQIYFSADFTGPVCLLMGAEDTGISKNLLALADVQVQIPLRGAIESLNVSVACGILAFEIVRQRIGTTV